MDYSDQRKHPRVNVDFYADWGRGPDCEHFDKITNLSAGGCFLATQKELSFRDMIYIRISDEMVGSLNLKAEVRYQLRIREGSPPTGVGAQFIGVSSENEQKLQQLVSHYRLAGIRPGG